MLLPASPAQLINAAYLNNIRISEFLDFSRMPHRSDFRFVIEPGAHESPLNRTSDDQFDFKILTFSNLRQE
jgi:hypothetical protein